MGKDAEDLKAWTSQKIKALRKRAGLSQERMAAAIGVSCSGYQKWEGGETSPSYRDHAKKLTAFERTLEISGDGVQELRQKLLRYRLLDIALGSVLGVLSKKAQRTILEAILGAYEKGRMEGK
ncbi:MAG: helix-turn-helix transcriptional regulator [candidate division NC10 bacterium]